MNFDTTQHSHIKLREILAIKTNQVFTWLGSGASVSAGLPDWPSLRKILIEEANKKITTLSESDGQTTQKWLSLAETEIDYWQSFQYLKKCLGDTSWRSTINQVFSKANNTPPPDLYIRLWNIGITGFLTTNIDRLATKAHASAFPNRSLTEFNGKDTAQYLHNIKSGLPFVANLHGSLNNDDSWIFTTEDLKKIDNESYRQLITLAINSRTILFIGISPDDQAIKKHFEKLISLGISIKDHFWLTHRNDQVTNDFAEQHGLLRIHYSLDANNSHKGAIETFLKDIERYKPKEKEGSYPPVIPDNPKERNINLPSPEELEIKTPEDIRNILNKEAVRILTSNMLNKIDVYNAFLEKYDSCIYRAWEVNHKTNRNIVFGYKLTALISSGGFGKVYKAISPKGDEVAIKVLLENIREEPGMLDGFRRGVQAMKILTDKEVTGIVSYRKSWEIPACTMMEYIDGYNIEQAVESGFIKNWDTILRVANALTKIINTAHNLPEHVLHRDVRPANIILRNFFSPDDNENWELVVLDFDLSWHRDASGTSVDSKSISQGYHAPEQTGLIANASTRSALVDSFGIGMTLYYLASNKHPLPQQVNFSTWRQDLSRLAESKPCPAWLSLPTRYSQLIYWSTQAEQHKRWDLTRMLGEITRLQICLEGNLSTTSAELVAEEIASRIQRFKGYEWDYDKFTAAITLPSGFSMSIKGDETKRTVEFTADWFNTGTAQYEKVRRYILPSVEGAISSMKKGGWSLLNKDTGYDRIRLTFECKLNTIKRISDIIDRSNAITNGLNDLTLN